MSSDTEPAHRGDLLHLIALADVGDDVDRLTAFGVELLLDLLERFRAPCREDELGALLGGRLGRRQADAARSAGEDDDLLVQGFEGYIHEHPAADIAHAVKKGATLVPVF